MSELNTPTRPQHREISTGDKTLDAALHKLLQEHGVEKDLDYYFDMLATVFQFADDKPHPADIRLFTRTMKEIRHANKIFAPYRGVRKVSIFGSARTAASEATYKTAEAFARLMTEAGYMVITGGGEGIMGAAQAGAGRDRSFALNIQLPFEQQPNRTIAGDPKLITFRYFFTRKLAFVKNSDAIALFPGGMGTMDEGFEAITLLQTGKAPLIPVVLVDEPRGNFWKTFTQYLREHLQGDGLISEEDFHIFKVTNDVVAAQKEIENFYYNFHSYRFVGDTLVLRTHREIPPAGLDRIQQDFKDILMDDHKLKVCPALPEERNQPELAHLPRLCLKFDMRSYGRLRQLIDRVNLY
jgi:uncharacterized protein (TIGR00730 family)